MFWTWTRRLRRGVAAGLVAGALGLGAAACGVSTQQEAQIGADYSAQINQELPVVRDAAVNRCINQLGERIAAQAQRPFDYRFFVVNTDQLNAFALPGGYVYLNRGLIEATDDLSELAGVLAHEVAHVELRHSAEQIERAQGANLGLTLAYVLMGRTPSDLERAGVNVVGTAVFAKYGRDAEREADRAAVDLLVRAGIDPRGLPSFFNELIEDRRRRPSQVEQWFSTHPLTEERISETRAMIDQVPASRLRGLEQDNRLFRDCRARVSRLPAARG